jgi:hypothetical protein
MFRVSQHRVVNSLILARGSDDRGKAATAMAVLIWASAFFALLIVEVLLVLL